MSGRPRLSWSVLASTLVACSLTQSLDGYEGSGDQPGKDAGFDAKPDASDAGCLLGTKRCGGACVDIDDPAFGCAEGSCTPCAVASHVQAVCSPSGCEPQGCEPGYASCDDDPTTGCETPLGTATDCSICGEVCDAPSGDVACDPSQLRCAIQNCPAGSGDCNGDPEDGCEDPLNSPEHCGACSTACPPEFSCTDAGGSFKCACSDSAGCNAGSDGECVQGLCVCGGGSLCEPGQRCLGNGECG